jgi:uncharacterized membrane protein YgdD (TMEM256/DUF423 family)
MKTGPDPESGSADNPTGSKACDHAIRLAAVLGFSGVALGAFGAHWLKPVLNMNAAIAIWQTAVLYHLMHAVAGLWAAGRRPGVTWVWAVGIFFFSGSLYALALTGIRWLGAVTPVGGVLFLVGWAMLIIRPK